MALVILNCGKSVSILRQNLSIRIRAFALSLIQRIKIALDLAEDGLETTGARGCGGLSQEAQASNLAQQGQQQPAAAQEQAAQGEEGERQSSSDEGEKKKEGSEEGESKQSE